MQDRELLDAIVRALVTHPEDLRVVRTVDDLGVLMTIHLNPEDMGKVIGRLGSTAKAIRTIMRAIGLKSQERINVRIVEPEGSVHQHRASDIYPGDIANPREGATETL